MDKTEEFMSYKKLLIFGEKGSGKSSLIKYIEKDKFIDKIEFNDCNIKVQRVLEDKNILELNICEIGVNKEFIENEPLIESILYECQCALFIVDVLEKKGFELIKSLLQTVQVYNKITKVILLINKYDSDDKKLPEDEIQDFIKENKWIETLNISCKTGLNINELIKKIYIYVNNQDNELPMNVISESTTSKHELSEVNGSLTFILIGDTEVGKSSFANRYFKSKFNEPFIATIGVNKENKFIKIANELYKINLWDTCGQERFRSLPKKYYQNADGVLLLFDVTKEESFNNVKNWIGDVKDNSNKISGENEQGLGIALYLIGNKIDKPDRVITKDNAQSEAASLGMKYFEASCKMNINIDEIMGRMIMDCYMKTNHIDSYIRLTTLKTGEEKKGGGCCGDKKKDKK